jgi:hypothetical protein
MRHVSGLRGRFSRISCAGHSDACDRTKNPAAGTYGQIGVRREPATTNGQRATVDPVLINPSASLGLEGSSEVDSGDILRSCRQFVTGSRPPVMAGERVALYSA